MTKQMTDRDILRLGKDAGLDISADESKRIAVQLNDQLSAFRVLQEVDVDGVKPMFGVDDGEEYKVSKRA